MVDMSYDPENDSMYISISSRKAYLTVEFSERIALDVTNSKIPVGVEILEASKFISDLFGKSVSKDRIKSMLCSVTQKDAIYLDFEMRGARRESARFAIPVPYNSPIVAAV